MSSFNTISAEKLARLIGTPNAPVLIDVRTDEDFAADPRLDSGRVRAVRMTVEPTGPRTSRPAKPIVICQHGQKLSEGAAAWLRQAGAAPTFSKAASKPGGRRSCRWSRRRSCRRRRARAAPSG